MLIHNDEKHSARSHLCLYANLFLRHFTFESERSLKFLFWIYWRFDFPHSLISDARLSNPVVAATILIVIRASYICSRLNWVIHRWTHHGKMCRTAITDFTAIWWKVALWHSSAPPWWDNFNAYPIFGAESFLRPRTKSRLSVNKEYPYAATNADSPRFASFFWRNMAATCEASTGDVTNMST